AGGTAREAARRAMPASPAGRREPPLQVLPHRDQQPRHVHLDDAPEAAPLQPVPLLRLAEERLDPDRALAHRLLVGGRAVIAPDALQIGLVEGAMDLPALPARGAGRFDRTGVAGGRVGAVGDGLV